jgi:hypothetical protein
LIGLLLDNWRLGRGRRLKDLDWSNAFVGLWRRENERQRFAHTQNSDCDEASADGIKPDQFTARVVIGARQGCAKKLGVKLILSVPSVRHLRRHCLGTHDNFILDFRTPS